MKLVPGQRLKHVQVREYVRALIVDAEPGTPAPSERELVQLFGVSRMTVRQALDALVIDGLLERSPGRGTFVAPPRRVLASVTGLSELLERRGLVAESRTLLIRLEHAGPGVARALEVSEGDSVIHWRRLRGFEGKTLCVEDVYLNEVLLPGFLHGQPPASLYEALGRRGLRPVWVEDTINADLASAEEAELLEIRTVDAVLRHARRGVAQDRVVQVSRTVYRSDRHTIFVQLGHTHA